jgi:hypothetical protein
MPAYGRTRFEPPAPVAMVTLRNPSNGNVLAAVAYHQWVVSQFEFWSVQSIPVAAPIYSQVDRHYCSDQQEEYPEASETSLDCQRRLPALIPYEP